MHNLKIDAQRLWDTIMATAEFGRTPKGGVRRLTLTDLDRQVRDWFVAKAKEAGCTVSVDQMGNIFAVRPGRDNSLPPIAAGSHLDTQPTGGKFDGILGVLAGLEVIRTLNDAGYETNAPVAVINWTNEEGSRFAPAMLASGVYAGAFTLDHAYSRKDLDGKTVGEELARIGYKGEEKVGERKLGAHFELHIEQGPILEAEGRTIGVVTGAQGIRWYDVNITGQDSHAGSTPMPLRRDSGLAAARLIEAINRIALDHAPLAVTTVGMARVEPNSRNVIPGAGYISVDMRHPEAAVLERMDAALRQAAAEIAARTQVEIGVEQIWYFPPVAFDPACIAAVRQSAQEAGFSHRDIVSGPGHDSCYTARKAPTSMIFIPCEKGISHNEAENITFDDAAAGANVLLGAMLAKANA